MGTWRLSEHPATGQFIWWGGGGQCLFGDSGPGIVNEGLTGNGASNSNNPSASTIIKNMVEISIFIEDAIDCLELALTGNDWPAIIAARKRDERRGRKDAPKSKTKVCYLAHHLACISLSTSCSPPPPAMFNHPILNAVFVLLFSTLVCCQPT